MLGAYVGCGLGKTVGFTLTVGVYVGRGVLADGGYVGGKVGAYVVGFCVRRGNIQVGRYVGWYDGADDVGV
jgi:hypothetical protein